MKLFKNPLFYTTVLSLSLLGLIIGSYVFGWVTPTEAPPGGNIVVSQGALPSGSAGYVQFASSSTDFGGDAALFWDNTNKRLGIGTTGPGAKLDVQGGSGAITSIKTDGYVEDVSGVVHGNLVSSHSWTISSGSIGIFSQNGGTAENSREWGIGPHGNRAILWKTTPDATSGPDGGWNSAAVSINHTKTYRSSVWIKKTGSADGNTYFGCSGSTTNNLDGTANSNPYFWAGDLPSLDKWYLLVGYIHGSGDTSTTSYGGIYDGETGKKVISMTDFENKGDATTQVHRTYLYYSTLQNCNQYWWDSRFEEVNGKEPTIEALLGLYKPATPAIDAYFGGNVGIGTTAPLAKLAINGGLHVGGDSDPGDNNLAVDGNIVGAGNVKLSSTGYIHSGGNVIIRLGTA